MEEPQVPPNNPPAAAKPVKAEPKPRTKHVAAARKAAAHTARASDPEEQNVAREWVAEQLRAGRDVAWRQLATESGRGETWCRARIREAKEMVSAPDSQPPSAERHGMRLVPVGGD